VCRFAGASDDAERAVEGRHPAVGEIVQPGFGRRERPDGRGHVGRCVEADVGAVEAVDTGGRCNHVAVDGSHVVEVAERLPAAVVACDGASASGDEAVVVVDRRRGAEPGLDERLAVPDEYVLGRRDSESAVCGRYVGDGASVFEGELADDVIRDADPCEPRPRRDERRRRFRFIGVDALFIEADILVAHTTTRERRAESVYLRAGTPLPSPVNHADMELFGSSGVRGVAGEELTPQSVLRIAAAAGTVLDADAVAIARDTRTTGRMFVDAAASGLASVGCSVHRLGIAPTPAAQTYAEREGVHAIVITASHNPAEYNGVKLVGDDGVELPTETLERIEACLFDEAFDPAGYDAVGTHHDIEGANDAYVRELLDRLDAEGVRDDIADAELTVALDPGHGAGCLTNPGFFRKLGCDVVTVNAQPDGHFPGRDPEPVAENLADLRRLVRTTDADLGVAHDGDADRAIFVDETGAHIEGDAALAALAAAELEAGDVAVSAVNVSQRLVDVVAEAEADLELTRIGSTYIITRIRELLSEARTVPIAGEGNGGILFPEYRIARDGAYTAARFLSVVVDRPASEVAAAHGGYENVRTNLGYDDADERAAMLEAVEAVAEDADAEVTTLDGYRLDYGDAWVLARPSGTEPLVRIYAEARSRDRAERLLEEMREAVEAARTVN
jgi:phosphomannomutase/phosphoglucomutase